MSASLKIPPGKKARLEAFVETLPLSACERLFAAIDIDRVRGGEGLPHTALLDMLRPILRERGGRFPMRAPTARRLFFTPFEDFLTVARRGRKKRARLPRSSIAAIWRILMTDPACAGAARAAIRLDRLLAENAAPEAIGAVETEMFAAAREGLATVMAHADEDDAYRADLGRRLRATGDALSAPEDRRHDPGAFDDLREIAGLLPVADRLRDVQRLLPKPVAALTEEELFDVRRIYASARADDEAQAVYVLLCVAARMETPWRALRLYRHLASSQTSRGRDGDAPRPDAVASDAYAIVESLFDDLEDTARVLERDSADAFDAADARMRLAYFADFAAGMIEEGRKLRDGAVVNRAEACRDIAANALQRFCEQALTAVRAAEPTRHAGGSSRLKALRPDIQRKVDPALDMRARDAAAFIAGAPDMAGRLERPGVVADLVAESAEQTRRYAEDLILEIRAAEGEERAAARRRMAAALDFAGPLLPEADIALMRDKAAAAALSA